MAYKIFIDTNVFLDAYFITSNIKDYKKASSELPALTPKQFIVIYKTN